MLSLRCGAGSQVCSEPQAPGVGCGGQSLCHQPSTSGPGQAGGLCTSPVTCDLSPPLGAAGSHRAAYERGSHRLVSLPLRIQGPALRPLPLLDASSPGWRVPGHHGRAGAVGAGGACPSVHSDPRALSWGGEPLPGLGGGGAALLLYFGKTPRKREFCRRLSPPAPEVARVSS